MFSTNVAFNYYICTFSEENLPYIFTKTLILYIKFKPYKNSDNCNGINSRTFALVLSKKHVLLWYLSNLFYNHLTKKNFVLILLL